ncbi:MAG: hypothetical protein WBV62_19165, partial [Roseobacter sp.]
MSGFDDNDDLGGDQNQNENPTSPMGDLEYKSSLEARLAVARAAREKVLKAKGKLQEKTPGEPLY